MADCSEKKRRGSPQPPNIGVKDAPEASARSALRGMSFAEGQRALSPDGGVVQRRGGGKSPGTQIRETAAAGLQGDGGALPHLDRIQSSFGGHELSGVKAHVGGAAASASQAMGAEAYTSGDSVAFRGAPSLHTAAHEAAHVIQQRNGVSLSDGVGRAGDSYEKNADAVADRVVAGRPATELLGGSAGARGGVQAKEEKGEFSLPEDKLAKARSYYTRKAAFWPPAQVQKVCAALGIPKRDTVDDAFIQAAARHQKNNGLSPIDGMAGGGTLVSLFGGAEMKRAYEIADKITGKYEGGSYGALQTKDSGIVSYGKHQTTLASGNLAKLLDIYLAKAKNVTPMSGPAKTIESDMAKVRGSAEDKEALRKDSTFTGALKSAASETAMQEAQDEFFYDAFWVPACKLALKYGITSQLGYAMVYDCYIQGGASSCAEGARKALGGIVGAVVGGTTITEKAFLIKFNDVREGRLEAIAKKKEKNGDQKTADMLRVSKVRPQAFKELAEAGNLDLSANVAGKNELEFGTYGSKKTKVSVPDQVKKGGSEDIDAGAKSDAKSSDEIKKEESGQGWLDSLIAMGKETWDAVTGYFSSDETNTPEKKADAKAEQLVVAGYVSVTASKLNVRPGPNTKDGAIGSVKSGDKLGVTGTKQGEWVQVVFEGKPAWVHGAYVVAVGTKEKVKEKEEKQPAPVPTATGVGALDQDKLKTAREYYKTNSNRYPAELVQEIQIKVGVSSTGLLDDGTIQAIAAYQKAKGYTGDNIDGKAGRGTLTKMFGGDVRMRPDAGPSELVDHDGISGISKSSVKLTAKIKEAWQALHPHMPAGAVLTSGLRSWADSARIMTEYFVIKKPSIVAKGLMTNTQADKIVADKNYKRMYDWLWTTQSGLKKYKVAMPGASRHCTGKALDISGAGLTSIQTAVITASEQDDKFKPLYKSLLREDANNCIHVNLN